MPAWRVDPDVSRPGTTEDPEASTARSPGWNCSSSARPATMMVASPCCCRRSPTVSSSRAASSAVRIGMPPTSWTAQDGSSESARPVASAAPRAANGPVALTHPPAAATASPSVPSRAAEASGRSAAWAAQRAHCVTTALSPSTRTSTGAEHGCPVAPGSGSRALARRPAESVSQPSAAQVSSSVPRTTRVPTAPWSTISHRWGVCWGSMSSQPRPGAPTSTTGPTVGRPEPPRGGEEGVPRERSSTMVRASTARSAVSSATANRRPADSVIAARPTRS